MRKVILVILLTAGVLLPLGAQDPVYNRPPLMPSEFGELPLGAIRPQGWLLQQLEAQRDGLTGRLDEVYPAVVGERNAWLGGDGDAWERGPYWIDGLLPLGYILQDNQLIAKAGRWVEAILSSGQENGFFGPSEDRSFERGMQRDNARDWWPRMVALKILKQYYMATGDKRILTFLTRYFRYQLETLPSFPLNHWTFWGEQRGGDNLEVVYWLYNLTGEAFLLELGDLIHAQTLDWTGIFWEGTQISQPWHLHCVNLAQGFKEPIVYWQRSGEGRHLEAPKKAISTIRHTVGFPIGLWAGDEMLEFGNPNRGSEFCTAVEMMFSLEEMLRITADPAYADHLERVAYNALPTQATDDFTARQYYQQVNQIECSLDWRNFNTPHENNDQVFGTLNGYACCLTNMHQGWPKLVQNLWYSTAGGGLAALVYGPSRVRTRVADGKEAILTEDTIYPFDGTVTITITYPDKKIKDAVFPISFRIPHWCKNAQILVNGEPLDIQAPAGTIQTVRRKWRSHDTLTLQFPQEVSVSWWYDRSAVVERGPLVYALKMDERWTRKDFSDRDREEYGQSYWEVTSDSPWNFALSENRLSPESFSVEEKKWTGDYPWNVDKAPVTIKAKAFILPYWTRSRGGASDINYHTYQARETGPLSDIELIPYGCTTLRITEFPVRPE